MKLTPSHISSLREHILSCDHKKVTAYLDDARAAKFSSTNTLVGFHDALLLLAAYPPTKALYVRADLLLKNFYLITNEFLKYTKLRGEPLVNTGLAGTEVHGAFTFPLLNKLMRESSSALFLHSFSEDAAPAGEILKHFLPESEFEVLYTEVVNEEMISALFGNEDQLQKILLCMEQDIMQPALRDQLFDNLKVFAGIRLDGSIPDRSSARGIMKTIFSHKELIRKPDPLEVIGRKLKTRVKLKPEQSQHLILHSMCMLATLNRETDPVTVCDVNGVTLFHLERGVSVALFSMQAERRMPLESYIGYVLFKNGIPLAYGGSWIFGNRALFGINIFEPFRGGESALIILQLLRVYHQYYGVNAFSVEPYQFGKDNPEGIQSGAYWFYYKMGFRSDDAKLAELAEKEFAKMQKSKSYRSSVSTLKKFTDSRITWKIRPDEKLFPDPSILSAKITACIREEFLGIRAEAIRIARDRYCGENSIADDNFLLLFLALNLDVEDARSKIETLSRLKRSDEREFNAFLNYIAADFQ